MTVRWKTLGDEALMEETDTAGIPWKSTSPLYSRLCPHEVNSPLSHNPATMLVPHHGNTVTTQPAACLLKP